MTSRVSRSDKEKNKEHRSNFILTCDVRSLPPSRVQMSMRVEAA